jgi:RimJ/RimL family protein N-acetyltransferase
MIETARLRLRSWRECDRHIFAALHADPVVMLDQGGPLDRAESDAKFARYCLSFDQSAIGRWAVETLGGDFLGYAGIMRVGHDHPLGEHHEIGWRFQRLAWGNGYATEAASAALIDAFTRYGLEHILSYTAENNIRSRAVMERLGFRRAAPYDFKARHDRVGMWHGQVWVANRDMVDV